MTDWDRNRAALRHHLETDKLEDFLNWSTIQKTMFVGDVGYVHDMLKEILADSFKLTNNGEYKISNILAETPTGSPTLFQGWTSGSLIVQLYHLKQWLDRNKKTVDRLSSIVEVGAGYGAMALICHRLGFRGHYHIIDLPELEIIQKYYLSNTGGMKWVSWNLRRRHYDLLIACHSLSEMPVDQRERLLSEVDADAYLFASSYEFEGVDNAGWFREFAEGKPGYEVPGRYRWEQWAHPYYENAFYQVGRLK
jgi:hypothetical protein